VELQHINAKLPVENPEEVDLELLIPIFHSWVRDQVCEELLLDVADYRHVEAGPGVLLIGHQANYSVDHTDGRLGIRYNRKAAVEGSNQDRLKQAARAALAACQRLESEPSLSGKLRFNGRELELFINDRLLAPNQPETRAAAQPEFQAFFRKLFGGTDFSISYQNGDSRRLLSVSVRTSRRYGATELLNNIVF
jgi:hypothetical protein